MGLQNLDRTDFLCSQLKRFNRFTVFSGLFFAHPPPYFYPQIIVDIIVDRRETVNKLISNYLGFRSEVPPTCKIEGM